MCSVSQPDVPVCYQASKSETAFNSSSPYRSLGDLLPNCWEGKETGDQALWEGEDSVML